MATVVDSIGTSSRDFSTMAAWHTSLSAHSGDDCFGECYNDSGFAETVSITETTPTTIELTAAAGEQHDGTAGSGVELTGTISVTSTSPTRVTWLDVDANGAASAFSTLGSQTVGFVLGQSLLHNCRSASAPVRIVTTSATTTVIDCFLYDAENTNATTSASGSCNGFFTDGNTGRPKHCLNTTIHRIRKDNGSTNAIPRGIVTSSSANHSCKNTLITDCDGTSTTGQACFALGALAVREYNASEDATADGTGSLTGLDPNDLYVDTTPGSEVLLLKAGADCIDAGTDLGTTPTGVNIDITGYDRHAGGGLWDIGAHEYVAPPSGGTVGRGLLTSSKLSRPCLVG